MHYRLFDFCKIHQPALHLFDSNAGVPAPTFVGLDARLGSVQQLLSS
jgi:hypothetical protein